MKGHGLSASDIRPWRRVQWSSPLSPPECREQLLDLRTPHARAGAPIEVHVAKWGPVFRIAAVYSRLAWAGGAYLDVYVVNAGNETRLIGRFVPAPIALIAASILGLVFSLAAVSLGSVGVSAFVRVMGHLVPQSAVGVGLFFAFIVLSMIGSFHVINFNRQCLEIVGHVERTCSAHRVDR